MNEKILINLWDRCYRNDFEGFDPFDGLEGSYWFDLENSSLLRLALIQFHKNSPFNTRKYFNIQPNKNPKGLALALTTAVNLYRHKYVNRNVVDEVFSLLVKADSQWSENFSIGYNFDWQNMVFFLPKGTPTIVNTAFAGHAFLDYAEQFNSEKAMEFAKQCANFIAFDLNQTRFSDGTICLSYSPLDRSCVHNANILGAGFLARLSTLIPSCQHKALIVSASDYLLKGQELDGSWRYGSATSQRFIDSFHTGFNLEQLYWVGRFRRTEEIDRRFELGYQFYLNNFFREDGHPKYYVNRDFPVDIHCPAQLLSLSGRIGRHCIVSEKVMKYLSNKLIKQDGTPFFRRGIVMNNSIEYMRWSNLWLLFGLSGYLNVADLD